MKKMVLVFLILFSSSIVMAQDRVIDDEHRDLALQLLNALKIGEQMSKQYDTMRNYQDEMLKEYDLDEMMGSNDYQNSRDNMWDTMESMMSWDNLKEDFIEAYAQVYSKEELRSFIEFFKSPMGKVYVDKTPQISKAIMAISIKKAEPMVSQGLQEARINANDALAQSILRSLSTACETYATVKQGNYPASYNLLLEAHPPYLRKTYCDKTENGYQFKCEMTSQSYVFTATPQEAGVTGSRIYKMSTGGILEKY